MGHALYVGIGAYTVGIFDYYGVTGAIIQWPAALLIGASVALLFGWLSLKTRGAYFIMITLALGQFGYFLAVGASQFGGDDGMTIQNRSSFGILLNLASPTQFYYLCLSTLALTVLVVMVLSRSYFGLMLNAARLNERRLNALGLAPNGHLLAAFVISATICTLAGVLLANQLNFVSPDLANWTQSGDLLVMLLIGGLRTLAGPIVGVLSFVLAQHVLTGITEYWQLILGPLLIVLATAHGKGLVHILSGARRV
jgi:branched-chain amino acid transport system permease protein